MDEKTTAILSGIVNIAAAICWVAVVLANFPKTGSTILDVSCCIALITMAVKHVFNAVQSFKCYDEHKVV